MNAGSLPRELGARRRAQTRPRRTRSAPSSRRPSWPQRFEDWGCRRLQGQREELERDRHDRRLPAAGGRGPAVTHRAPLHVGVTEAGTVWSGAIKSAVGIGTLLAEGIGDTIRVSLTGDPVEEVRAAWKILAALGLRRRGPDVISCPTCARTEIDIVRSPTRSNGGLAADPRLAERPFTVAVMGCRVNGPEEAKHADYGIAAGAAEGVLFDHGERVATVPEDGLVEALFERIEQALV